MKHVVLLLEEVHQQKFYQCATGLLWGGVAGTAWRPKEAAALLILGQPREAPSELPQHGIFGPSCCILLRCTLVHNCGCYASLAATC